MCSKFWFDKKFWKFEFWIGRRSGAGMAGCHCDHVVQTLLAGAWTDAPGREAALEKKHGRVGEAPLIVSCRVRGCKRAFSKAARFMNDKAGNGGGDRCFQVQISSLWCSDGFLFILLSQANNDTGPFSSQNFFRFPVKSDFRTHTWNIKYNLKK